MPGQSWHFTGVGRLIMGIVLLRVGRMQRRIPAGGASTLPRLAPLCFLFAASVPSEAAGVQKQKLELDDSHEPTRAVIQKYDGDEQCLLPGGSEGAKCDPVGQAERRLQEKKGQLDAAVAKAEELEQALHSAKEEVERRQEDVWQAELKLAALGKEVPKDGTLGPPLRWRSAGYENSKSGMGGVYGGDHTIEMFAKAGYSYPVKDDSWDVLFTHYPMIKALADLHLPPRQGRVVHNCGYFTAAGQKCRLAAHVARTQLKLRMSGGKREDGPRYLTTYELAEDQQADAWISQLEEDPKRYWLIKKCVGGLSQAVTLVNGEQMEQAKEAVGTWAVAQEYIQKPFMGFGGRKFHLRMYLVVTSWHPVAAFLYNEGVIFRSLKKYNSKQPSSERDIFSGISQTVEPLAFGSLWDTLGANRSAKVWADVVEMLSELLGNELERSFGDASQLSSQRGFECFDLMGADVLLDSSLHPLLMEINTGPDMWVSSHGPKHEAMLHSVKGPLLTQLAQWAGLRSRLGQRSTRLQAEMLERRTLLNFTRLVR